MRRSERTRERNKATGRSGPKSNKSRLTLVTSPYSTRSIGGEPPPSSSLLLRSFLYCASSASPRSSALSLAAETGNSNEFNKQPNKQQT